MHMCIYMCTCVCIYLGVPWATPSIASALKLHSWQCSEQYYAGQTWVCHAQGNYLSYYLTFIHLVLSVLSLLLKTDLDVINNSYLFV